MCTMIGSCDRPSWRRRSGYVPRGRRRRPSSPSEATSMLVTGETTETSRLVNADFRGVTLSWVMGAGAPQRR